MLRKLVAVLLSAILITSGFTSVLSVNAEKKDKTDNSDSTYVFNAEKEGYETGLTNNTLEEPNEVEMPKSIEEVANQTTTLSCVDNTLPKENGKTYFPPIGDQGGVGSCWAWSKEYYGATYTLNRYYDREVDLSNTVSPKYAYVYKNGSSFIGGHPLTEYPNDKFQHESDLEQYPADYGATEEMQMKALSNKVSYYSVDVNIDTMKSILASGEILLFSTTGNWIDTVVPNGEKYAGEEVALCSLEGEGHALTIVGYDDDVACDLNQNGIIEEAERGAFKVANSWGEGFGNKGYIWFSYDAFIANSTKVTITGGYERYNIYALNGIIANGKELPDSYAVVTVETSSRKNVFLSVSYTYNTNNGSESGSIEPWIRELYCDKNVNYSGTTGIAEATFVIDLHNIVSGKNYKELEGKNLLDLSNLKWGFSCKDTVNDEYECTVKDVHFVDNINHITYGVDKNLNIDGSGIASNGSENTFTILISKIIPTILEVNTGAIYSGDKNNIEISAKDDKDGLSYAMDYKSADGKDVGSILYHTSSEITWTPNTYGEYDFIIKVKDSDGYVTKKHMSVNVLENKDITIKSITPSIEDGKVTAGQEVIFSAEATGGTSSLKYQFLVNDSIVQEYSVNKSFAWTSQYNGGPNKITVNVKDDSGAVASDTILYTVNPDLSFSGYSFFPSNHAKVNDTVNITMSSYGGTGTIYRSIEATLDGNTETIISHSSASINSWIPKKSGTYDVKLTLTDSNGISTSKTVSYIVEPSGDENVLHLYYENGNFSNAYVHFKVGNGNWTTVPGMQMEKNNEQSGYTWKYDIDLGDSENAMVCFNNGSGTWDSRNGANYVILAGYYGVKNGVVNALEKPTITPTVKPTITPTVTPTITPTITPTATPVVSNQSVLYYANDSWSQAYIHYKVGDGAWTTVPGMKMETSSEQSGYIWKYVVDLGAEENATVCFNDGNGNWDSKNGSNYLVTSGVYGIKNQSVTQLAAEFMISKFETSSSIGGTNKTMYLEATGANGTEPYSYEYSYVLNGTSSTFARTTASKISWTPYTEGTYTLKVKATDAEGKTAEKVIDNFVVEGPKISNFTASVSSPQQVGTAITLEGTVENVQEDNYNMYSYTVTRDGVTTELATNNRKALWTPESAGVYTVEFKFTNYSGSIVLTKTMTYTINDVISNSATVYYANSSWSQAYIHYKAGNGTWTSVPGVKMSNSTEQRGYTWKYEIDLGDASNATVCFNNGSGTWDSNNGANYTVGAGTYGIKSGTVTSLSNNSVQSYIKALAYAISCSGSLSSCSN